MTAKNRQKSSEKSAAPGQEDAAKKSPKSSTNGMSGPGPQGAKSGSCLGLVATTVFYIAMLGAAGFAAFYLQQVVEEIRQTNSRNEESARQNAELSSKMENAVQQVESLRSVVDGLESSLGITRGELEAAVTRMKRGEVETRRVEEALQKLQNNLLNELSEGIKEVKESREKDFSSLEKAVEERLAEVSQSIAASVAEFTGAQGQAQSQLAELKARLSDMEDPALIKRELSAIVDAVAETKTAQKQDGAQVDSLREQIGTVRQELQTRNQEVASLSGEVETVRKVVHDTNDGLRKMASAAEAQVLDLTDQTQSLQSGLEQVTASVRGLEERVQAADDKAQARSEDLEARVKAAEESGDSASASLADITTRVEALSAKVDAQESGLAALGESVARDKAGLRQELEAVRSSLEALRSNTAQSEGASNEAGGLEKRLAALEERSSRLEPEQLDSLRAVVDGLESKATKLEGHDQAISSLQEALQQTTETLAALTQDKRDQRGA
ncbi:unnamed protein product [Menidia menidia]|uniref:(Atlantic silverside) hypothetical protein n=1 Tax=Menidia menidia TaxID=238744 RepID=A0A8S4B603_9TELE|nr:unnamed protein product [Menidia menidia]